MKTKRKPEQQKLVSIPVKRWRLWFRSVPGCRPMLDVCVRVAAVDRDWAIEHAYQELFKKYHRERVLWKLVRIN